MPKPQNNIVAIDITVEVTPAIKSSCSSKPHKHILLGSTLKGTLVKVCVPCGLNEAQIDAIIACFNFPDFILDEEWPMIGFETH
jgi:hypothetical protein